METYKELTEQAHAFPQLQRGRPSATVRATRFVTPEGVCANESLPPRAAGAARPSSTQQAHLDAAHPFALNSEYSPGFAIVEGLLVLKSLESSYLPNLVTGSVPPLVA